MNSKEIKVYGTLVNKTTDPNDQHEVNNNGIHNGYIAYAYQLYDDQFSTPANINDVNNYQDVINKRLTNITYSATNVTINGNTYNDVTHIEGDTYIDNLITEDITIEGTVSGLELNDLDDVNATKVNNNVLTYDSTSEKWINKSISTLMSEVLALNDLSDVTISSAANKQVLMYNSTTSNWENHTLVPTDILPNGSTTNPHLVWDNTNNTWVAGKIEGGGNGWTPPTATADGQVIKWDDTNDVWYAGTDNDHPTVTSLTDTTINAGTLTSGQVLKWNGTAWVNDTLVDNDHSTLASLTDTEIGSTITSGYVLKWNGTKWVPAQDNTGGGGGSVDHLNDIGDVDAASPTSGQFLTWDGTAWVAGDVSASCNCDMESLISRISQIESQYCTVTFLSDMNNPNSIISQIQIPKYSALYIAQFPNRVVGMMDTNSMQYKFGWVPVKFMRVIDQQTQQEIWQGTQSGEAVLPADGESLSTDTSGTQYEATLFTEDVYLAFHVVMTGGGSGTTPSLDPSTISLASGINTRWITDDDGGGTLIHGSSDNIYEKSSDWLNLDNQTNTSIPNIPLNIRFELQFMNGSTVLPRNSSTTIATTTVNSSTVNIKISDLTWQAYYGTSTSNNDYDMLIISGTDRGNGHLGYEDLAMRSRPQYQDMVVYDSIPMTLIGSYNGSQVVKRSINVIVYREGNGATSTHSGETNNGPWWG